MTAPSRPVDAIYDPNPTVQHDCKCIKRIQVVTQPRGGNLIAWEVWPGFKGQGPFWFFIDVARSGAHGEWQSLNTLPVVDDCIYMDHRQRHYDHLADFSYRVRLMLPNEIDPETGHCKVCLSQPQQANGLWSKRDWLLAREIARKENLLQAKRTNMTAVGFILKRRRWGQPCVVCQEFDTKEVQATCNICYSTGFVGGYFKAIDYVFTVDAPWDRNFKRDETLAVTNNITRKGRGLAYPFLDTNDLFVRKDTGERFYINTISQVAEVGGVPIIINAELKLAPVTDDAYDVPLGGGTSSTVPQENKPVCGAKPSSSSSSAIPEPDCDYRVGKDKDGDW